METRTFTLSSYDISPSDNLADYYNKTVSSQYGTVTDNRMSLTWNNVNLQQIVGNDFYNTYNQFSIKLINVTLTGAPSSSLSLTTAQQWQDAFVNVYLIGLPFYPPAPNGALMNVINNQPTAVTTGSTAVINYNSSLSWTFLKTSTANLGINIRCVATEQPYNPGDIMTNMRGHSLYTFEIAGLTDVSNVSYVDLSNGSVLTSGAHTIYTDLTPNDTNNYIMSSSISNITVTPIASSIAFSPSIPSYVVYETDLSNVLVTTIDEQNGEGTTRYYLNSGFTNEVTKTSILDYGSYTIYALFTPSSGGYSSSSTSTSLIVTQKSTSIVYTTPSSIVYGTTIASSLTATCTVSGEIAYFYDASFNQAVQTTDVKDFGTHTIYARFTPATNNYLPSSTSVSLSVTKAPTTLTYNALSAITYGTTIGASLNATSSIGAGTTNYYLDSAYSQLLSSTDVLNTSTTPYTIYAVFTPSSSNYSPSYASSSITVNKLQTTITFPNISSFIYETTMSGFISGTTAGGVAGTFAFSQNGNTLTSESVLSVGTYTIDATFTPSDLSNYLSSSNTKSLTVSTLATSIAFAGSIPSSVVYNSGLSSVLSVVVTPNVAGSTSYHYVNASSENVSVTTTSVLAVGSYTIHATFTPSSSDYAGSSTTTSLTVTQATPTVTYSGLSGIVYETTLAESLTATISPSIDGSFNYYIGSTEVFPTTVFNAGSYTINAIFTSRNANYTNASQQTGLTISKFTPTLDYNINNSIVYGTTIASSLTATSDIAGTFAYSIEGNALSSTDVLNVGTYTILATFTPLSTSNYESESISESVTVDKQSTSITFPSTSSIVYETTMSSFISGTTVSNGVAGTFAFSANDTTITSSSVLSVGTYTISCTFTPSDTNNYLSSNSTKSLSVSTKSTTLAFASSIPSSIVYGNTLAQVSIMVITPDVSGTLRFYTDSDHTAEVQTTTVLDAGDYTIYSTFTPTNSNDYTSSSASTNLTVTKATTAVTYPTLSNIVYGTTMSTSFSAYVTPSILGAFSYYYMDGTTKISISTADLLNVGSYTIYVDFTPNSSNYTGSSNNRSLTVTTASTTVIYDTPSDIDYTATLASSLTATAYPNIAGSMKYYINESEVTSTTTLNAGTYSISATFTPTGNNYTISTTTRSLTVNKKSTTITFPNISTIIYMKSLSTLIGGTTTGVAGTYSFFENDLNGTALSSSTVLETGSYTIFCSFVPTDSANYLSSQSTKTISVSVMSTSLSFSVSIPSSIVYETTLESVLVTNLVSNVDGTTSYTVSGVDVSAGTILNVGTYTIVATFTPSDTDYAQSSVSTTISVTQYATTLDFTIPSSIAYGTTLNSSFTATCAKAGTISYFYDSSHTLVVSENDTLNVGTYTIYALFTPSSSNYLSSVASATLTVIKSATTITFGSGVPSVLTYETNVANVLNTQVSPSIAGTTTYYYGTRVDLSSNDILVVGSYTVYAEFVPTDSANYSSSTVTMSLLVSQKPITVIFSGLSAITYGQTLASSLTASLGETLDGSMNYYTDSSYTVQVTSETILNAGSYTIYARFTPTNGNYVSYPVSTSLVVNKIATTVTYTLPSATIVYGTQLQSSFTASVSPDVSGSFKYYYLNDELSSSQILNAGTYAIRAAFTSSDPNYADASTTANLAVSQQTPSITFGVSSLTFGTTFQTFINGTTASTAGTFSFYKANSVAFLASDVLGAAVYTVYCTFSPTDTTNYTVKMASSELTVKVTTVLSNFTIPAKPIGTGNFYIIGPTSNRPGISYFSYTSSNTSVATVTGSVISVVGIGTSTITATQASSDSYFSGTATTVFQVYGVGTYTENGINYIYHIGLGTAEVSGVTAERKLLSTATILSSFVVGGTTYTVTIIGYGAFYDWTNLTNLSLPSSITTLEGSAFSSCINLTNIDLPSTITTMGSNCFSGSGLTTFTFPPLVTTIEERTFSNTALTSITIPSTITTVKYVFDGRHGGSSSGPFGGCTQLVNIVVNTFISGFQYVFWRLNNVNMTVTFNYPGIIPENCLESKTNLKTLIVGNQITGIGRGAFYDCTGLTNVTFGSSLTTIGNYSFGSCSGLTNITLPQSLTTLGENTFKLCTSLNNIVLPSAVTTIGYGAFESCTSFTSVTIPSSVTSVGYSLFLNCTNLTNIVVKAPNLWTLLYTFNSVNSLNLNITFDYAGFVYAYMCVNVTSLKSVILSELITGIEGVAFSGCTGLTEIIFPPSITTIQSNAFFGCTNLNSVSFFGNIPSIGSNNFTSTTDSAFYKVDGTTNTNATTVSNALSMFTNKVAITEQNPTITNFSVPMKEYNSLPFSIVDPSSNSGGGFTYTSSNTSVATVSGKIVTIIGSGTTTITATQSANYKNGVYYASGTVTTTFVVNKIATTVTYTLPSATIVYGTELQSSFTASVSPDVSGSFKYYNLNSELSSSQILNAGTYTIRAAFTSSNSNYADASNTANLQVLQQTPSITFGVSKFQSGTTFQTFINGTTASTPGTFAFSNATGGTAVLASNVLVAGVYTINCTFTPTDTTNYTVKTASSALTVELTTVINSFTIIPRRVGSGIFYIGSGPTSNRSGFINITSSNPSVATITHQINQGIWFLTPLTVGNTTITASQESTPIYTAGSSSANFNVYAVGPYTYENVNYEYNIGLGTADVLGGTSSLSTSLTVLESFVIDGTTYTVTHIRDGAFSGRTNLTSISLPPSILTMGFNCFSGTGLTTFTFPPLVTTIEERTFSNSALTSITIPSTITTIKYIFDGRHGGSSSGPFGGCTQLVNIVVNTFISGFQYVFWRLNNVNMTVTFNYPGIIPENCLEGKTNLKTLIVGNQITGIGRGAFYDCTGLTNVTFGSSLTTIGNYSFGICSGLTNITLPQSLTTLGENAFKFCTSLNNIVLPSAVTTIMYGAFESCTSFTSVTIPSSVTTIGYSLFLNCTNLTNIVVKAPNLWALLYTFNNVNSPSLSITFDYPGFVYNYICMNVTSLKSVILSELITGIEGVAFSGCTGLTEIIFPSSITTIHNNAFFNCTNLNSVSFFGNIPSIGSNNFTSTTDSAFYKVDGTTNTNATTVSNALTMFTNKAAITAGNPTITNFSVPLKKYNSLPFSIVDPSSNSGGDFTYTSSNTSVATVSGKIITVIASGTTTITATQSPNYKNGVNYTSGTITTTFVVDNPPPQLGPLVITNKSLSDVSFLMVNPTQPNDSTGTWTYSSSDTTKATVSGNTVTLLNVGIVTITGTITSDSNYTSSTVVAVFSISPADVVPSTFTFVSSTAVSTAITTTVQTVPTTVVVSSENFTPEELQTLNPSEGTLVEKIENRNTLVDSLFNIFSNAETVSIPPTAFYMPPTIDSSNISQVTVFKTAGTTSKSPLVINASTINSTTSFFCPIDEVDNSVLFNGTSTFAGYSVKVTRASDTNYTIVQTKQGVPTTYTAVKDDIIYYAGFKLVIDSIAGQLSPLQLVVLSNFSIPIKTLADTTFTITRPTTTSNGDFTYTSSTPQVATVSGDIVTVVGLGTATITAVQARTTTHLSDTTTTTLTVNKIVTVLTNFVVPVKTVVDASFSIIAPTSNSTGVFTYTSSNTAVATISGDIITIVGAGTSTITANQSTTDTHATQTTTTTFTVNKVITVLTNFSVPTKTFGDASFNITTPTTNSNGAITYTSSNTAVATIVGSRITIVGAGTSTITASQATNAIYASETTTTTFTVNQITAVLTNFSIPVKTFGNADFAIVTPTSNSSGLITYTSSNTSVATIVGSTITIVGGGTSTITAVQASTTNYTSGTITTSLTINQAVPTITNFSVPIKTFGDASFNIIPPTSNSTGLFTYTSSNTSVATIVDSTITIIGVGTSTITAVQASTTNYTSGTITTSLTVNQAVPTITNFSVPTKAFGDASFNIITPTSNSTGLITYTSSNTAVATIVGSTITILGVGTSTITASQASTANYTNGTMTTSLTVNKAAPVITNFAVPTKTFGDASFNIITPTSNSTGLFTYTSSNTSVATIVGSTITIVGGGTTTITASQATTTNYLAATVTATLTVNQKIAVITSFAVPTKTLGDASFEIIAPTSTSNGLFTYTSSNTAIATIAGSQITIVGFGSLTITAVQASTSNFLAATTTAVFQVNNVAPTITSFVIPAKTFGDVSFSLVAPTSNSAGDFTYTSSNVSVATIVGSSITIIGAGSSTITASQTSTPSFAAGSISTTFTVNQAVSTLSSFSVPTKTFGNTAFSISPPISDNSGSFTYTSSVTSVATIVGNMTTIVGVGTSIITALFTPSSPNFATASTTSSLVVTRTSTTVSYPAVQGLLYSDPLGNTRLNATVSPVVAGTMAYFTDSSFTNQVFSTTTLTQGSYTLYARFTPTSSNYIGSSASSALTVFQLIPTAITFPNVSTIPVYTTLESFINGTTTGIPGTYVFRKNNSTGAILTATSTFDTLGNFLVYCSFTPTSILYSDSFSSYIAKVKFTPTILFTQRPSSTITYGTNLTGSALSTTVSQFNNTNIAGTITYSNSITTNSILLPGLYTVTATFTPTNLSLFNVATTSKQILVNKQQFTINITSPSVKSAFIKSTPIDCSYQVWGILSALGDTFENSVNGTIVNRYTSMDETVLLTSDYVYNTTFSGSSQTYKIAADISGFSSIKYDFVPQSYTFTVNKYTPTINYTIQTANKTLTYGTKLSTSQLNAVVSYGGNAVTSGSVVYTRSAINLALTVDTQTALDVGQHYLYAYFSDPIGNLYNSVDTSTVTTNRITIDKATPTFSFPNISSILSGSTLADIIDFVVAVSNGSDVAGTFAFTYVNGSGATVSLTSATVLTSPPSTITITATFTPIDTTRYNVSTGTKSVQISDQSSSISTTALLSSPIVYGKTFNELYSINVSPSALAGTFAYYDDVYTFDPTQVIDAGSYNYTVIFNPSSSTYASSLVEVAFTVTNATMTITYPSPPSYQYQTANQLSLLQPAKSVAIDGVMEIFLDSSFTTPLTPMAVGTHTIYARFTPAKNYNVATTTTTLTVTKIPTSLLYVTQTSSITFGETNASFLNNSVVNSIQGTIQYYYDISFTEIANSTDVLGYGTQTVYYRFVPTDSNYATSYATHTVTVNKNVLTILYPALNPIQYGTTLASSLSASSTFDGSINYFINGNQVYESTQLNGGSYTITAVFTSSNPNNFTTSTVSTTRTLIVTKQATVITYAPTSNIVSGTTFAASMTATISPNIEGNMRYFTNNEEILNSTVLATGNYIVSVTFTPTNLTNYTSSLVTVPITVITGAQLATFNENIQQIQNASNNQVVAIVSQNQLLPSTLSVKVNTLAPNQTTFTAAITNPTATTGITSVQFNFLDGSIGSNVKVAVSTLTVNLPGAENSPAIYFKFYDETGNSVINGNNRVSMALNLPEYKGLVRDLYLLRMQDIGTDFDGTKIPLTSVNPTDSQNTTFTAIFTSNSVYVGSIIPSATNEVTDGPLLSNVYTFQASGGFTMQRGFDDLKLRDYTVIETYDVTDSVQVLFDVALFNAKLGITKNANNTQIISSTFNPVTDQFENNGVSVNTVSFTASEFVDGVTKSKQIISVGKYSNVYNDFKNYVSTYFGYDGGFSSLFTAASEFTIDDNNTFDSSSMLQLFTGVTSTTSAYINEMSGSFSVADIVKSLRYSVNTNCFGNRNPTTSGVAVDPANSSNYGVGDGFVAGDLIWINSGTTLNLNLNIDAESFAPLNNSGPEYVSQMTNTTSLNFSQTTTASTTNINRTVRAPMLIKLVNASTISSL